MGVGGAAWPLGLGQSFFFIHSLVSVTDLGPVAFEFMILVSTRVSPVVRPVDLWGWVHPEWDGGLSCAPQIEKVPRHHLWLKTTVFDLLDAFFFE